MIKTFEEARLLVRELKICTLFESSKTELPSLWEHVDLPEKQEGEKGWGQKVTAVWDWKNRLPATFPDEIFYGKITGWPLKSFTRIFGIYMFLRIEFLSGF